MNNRESLVNFILSVVKISKDDAEKIANTFHPIEFQEKDYLLRANEVSDDYLYLERGLMRTFLYNLEGEEITIDFFTEDNIVFEITSFFNRIRSEAYIQAITKCKGFRISYEELNTLFHTKPAFRDFGRAILVKEFIASQGRNYGMINRTAKERYQNLLSTKPQILQYAPLKCIASYLGVTDSTLSRLRKKM
ncbi:Crp/Fnr family transcriptional regulator [Flagellimonas flava]|uniref:cAMP-binding domain of CRP or a regulatory subunit of cAMP-dependent protein kinases n=1 Tax=Flagellimonas flava TaxID=570519 RepID=A0A1M5IKF1_9FLAO|nr:Crp/Fnr family transcriptional regulator [Allomuricauda flava]SHG28716.1 cAMP-binding domain of CRP or a regulatory subunit of cAMP-dependent protein kinases [Allomuricauda flava]